MRIKVRLDGRESLQIAVKEAIITVYNDGSDKIIGYAEFHSPETTGEET